jgi:hypothetical protein
MVADTHDAELLGSGIEPLSSKWLQEEKIAFCRRDIISSFLHFTVLKAQDCRRSRASEIRSLHHSIIVIEWCRLRISLESHTNDYFPSQGATEPVTSLAMCRAQRILLMTIGSVVRAEVHHYISQKQLTMHLSDE